MARTGGRRKLPRKTPAESQVEADLEVAEEIRDAAKHAGSWSAAVQAHAKVCALRQRLDELLEARRASVIDDPIERIEHQITQAERAGSWQAAGRLNAQRAELIEEQQRRERELARENDLDAMQPDELVGMIVGAAEHLPDVALEQIGQAIAARLGLVLDRPRIVIEGDG